MKMLSAFVAILMVVCWLDPCASDPVNCQAIADAGEAENGQYTIDPDGDGGLNPFVVQCKFSRGNQSVIHHDQEQLTAVPSGYEAPGSYGPVVLNYTHNLTQMIALIESSASCIQMIQLNCSGVQIWKVDPDTGDDFINSCWNNRIGDMRLNWGANAGTEGCKCNNKGDCINDGQCNCDSEEDTMDKGALKDEDDLPVYSVQFGDTGDEGEQSWYKVGALRCKGYAAEKRFVVDEDEFLEDED